MNKHTLKLCLWGKHDEVMKETKKNDSKTTELLSTFSSYTSNKCGQTRKECLYCSRYSHWSKKNGKNFLFVIS